MNFDVLTIFPDIFSSFWNYGIISKAIENEIISICSINIRDFTNDKHKTVDDRPYGGGCGMVMKPEPIYESIKFAKNSKPNSYVVLLSPQGRVFNQKLAQTYANKKNLMLICGRYEGVDERICNEFIDEELSIGDFVLSGGESAALVVIDAVTRLLPGVVGCADSVEYDSFSNGLLDYAQYTRPSSFMGEDVPDVLLSGNHKKINEWRIESSLVRTFLKRPDLLEKKVKENKLTQQEIKVLKHWSQKIEKFITCL